MKIKGNYWNIEVEHGLVYINSNVKKQLQRIRLTIFKDNNNVYKIDNFTIDNVYFNITKLDIDNNKIILNVVC